MDLHHSPPRKRLKSFHAVSQDTAQFAHPGHAETVPMDIDRSGDVARGSPTILGSSGVNAELVALADKMELEIHMHLPWRDFIGLAEATVPLRDAGFQLSVTFDEEEWSDIPSQYRDFHKALATKAITGVELDAANLRFQQDMPEFIADQLTAYGTRGFRPNKRRWHSSLANIS
ncbi:hypothetical protein FCIRC_7277 [Fusarium circinatum]|uniref:Uncharacterized protein n=1 Tax=Fusarium circinatum TaxID=48490 RepID=A0A8H5TUI5_FUSCI|nr:hypothetical protein FCIRC_7277 [Fusarium circinatum]